MSNSAVTFNADQERIVDTLLAKYYESLSYGIVYNAKVTLTNAEIETGFTSPITGIIAAPGAGKAIKILNVIGAFVSNNGDDYSGNTQLAVYSTSGGISIFESPTTFLAGTNAQYSQYFEQSSATGVEDQFVENSSISVRVETGDPVPTGSPDVEVTLYITYQIVSL